jgi:hypothetical protein
MRIKKIWHPWNLWECYPAGFYSSTLPEGMDAEAARQEYRKFLSNIPRFEAAMERVSKEWPTSCEHFLTNEQINRIAWLGQSSMCIETGIGSAFRGGFKLLTMQGQRNANAAAQAFLTEWLRGYKKNGRIHKNMGGPGIPGGNTRRGSARINAGESSALIQGNLFCYS